MTQNQFLDQFRTNQSNIFKTNSKLIWNDSLLIAVIYTESSAIKPEVIQNINNLSYSFSESIILLLILWSHESALKRYILNWFRINQDFITNLFLFIMFKMIEESVVISWTSMMTTVQYHTKQYVPQKHVSTKDDK